MSVMALLLGNEGGFRPFSEPSALGCKRCALIWRPAKVSRSGPYNQYIAPSLVHCNINIALHNKISRAVPPGPDTGLILKGKLLQPG
jgi:hypothetical protein